jgi:MFS family permease
MKPQDNLLTREFVVLAAVMLITFCNIALFFELHQYLTTLPIAPQWIGVLIGLYSAATMILRPVIAPLLTTANALRWIRFGVALIVAALISYGFAQNAWAMAVVRIVHGAGYVLVATAVLTRLVACIPPAHSGQAFGLLAVLTLLPYAVVPPLVEYASYALGSYPHVLRLAAVLMLAVFPLSAALDRTGQAARGSREPRITRAEVLTNITEPAIALLLTISFLVWFAFAPVFYFIDEYGHGLGISSAGWFFTMSISMEIAIRIVAGSLFDRIDKWISLAGSLLVLGLAYFVLAGISSTASFIGVAFAFGLGWGVCLPVVNGLVFDISAPRFRALNSNLSMFMFQAGLFVGPVVGSAIMARWGYGYLYSVCGAVMLAALALTLSVRTAGTRGPE